MVTLELDLAGVTGIFLLKWVIMLGCDYCGQPDLILTLPLVLWQEINIDFFNYHSSLHRRNRHLGISTSK